MSSLSRARQPASRFTPVQPTEPAEPPPDRLPPVTLDGVITRARGEGVTRGRMLESLVEYALREMPPGWRP